MFFFIYIALSILVGIFAANRGRTGFAWVLVAMLISPLLAFLIVLIMDDKNKSAELAQLVVCPFCAETIKREALVCKHCGRDVPKQEPKTQEYYC